MTWNTAFEGGLIGSFGSPEVCKNVCPAWWFTIEPLFLSDPDVEGNDVLMPNGVWRRYARIPTTTRVSLRGEVFGELDPDGVALASTGYKGMVANLSALRTALKTDRSTGDGILPIFAELDGTTFGTIDVHVLAVKSSDWKNGYARIVVEVEVPGEGEHPSG